MTKKQTTQLRIKTKTAPIPGLKDAMRELEKLMAGGGLVTQGDLSALLKSLNGPSPEDGLSDEEADKRSEAQQLAFDAHEARTEAQALKLAKRALSLHPDCVDALVVRAEIECDSRKKLIEAMQSAVAAGERSLGATFIRENTGYFWGLLDTRPYMRAMAQLAELLAAEGLNLDAVRIYEKMLVLNPNDNQGVRDPLLGVYLCIDDLPGASRLLNKYEEDATANFAWGRVLERVLAGDAAGAMTALKKARKANHFVELFLAGREQIPNITPETYTMGSREEAVLCMMSVGRAWAMHKEAVFWLLDKQVAEGRPAIPSKAALKRVPVARERVQ